MSAELLDDDTPLEAAGWRIRTEDDAGRYLRALRQAPRASRPRPRGQDRRRGDGPARHRCCGGDRRLVLRLRSRQQGSPAPDTASSPLYPSTRRAAPHPPSPVSPTSQKEPQMTMDTSASTRPNVPSANRAELIAYLKSEGVDFAHVRFGGDGGGEGLTAIADHGDDLVGPPHLGIVR